MGIGTIVGDGVDIDPPVLEGDMSAERTHITFFKLEAIDLQLVEETNRYIYRLLAIKILFTHPENFGISAVPDYYKKIRRR